MSETHSPSRFRPLHESADLYVPDGLEPAAALARTTHLGVGAHADDLEVFAAHGIFECFRRADLWFGGVTLTDGAGSARSGVYAELTDADMVAVRRQEQRKAAFVGEYGFQAQLAWPSRVTKDAADPRPTEDLGALLAATRPQVVYTHSLLDKHDTHVAVVLRLIEALRRTAPKQRPARLLGCEVWRNLDWLGDDEKVVLDCGAQENLQNALVAVFDSQISGGKRYDLATMGRRRANATFFESHAVDQKSSTWFAMDLGPLLADDSVDPASFALAAVDRFREDVATRIRRSLR